MRKKIICMVCCMLLIGGALFIFPTEDLVKADIIEEDTGIDESYIHYITQELSEVIENADYEGDIKKGRAYGTPGEHYAADSVLISQMRDVLELEDIADNFKEYIDDDPHHRIDDKIFINERRILINASSWQAQTSYQKMLNFVPDSAKLPIVDLKTGNATTMDFSQKNL